MKNAKRFFSCLLCFACMYVLMFPVPIKLCVEVTEYSELDNTQRKLELDGWYYWYLLKDDQFSLKAQTDDGAVKAKLQAHANGERQPLFVWSQTDGYLENGWVTAKAFLRYVEMCFVDEQGNEYVFSTE